MTELEKTEAYRHLDIPDSYSLMQWAQTDQIYSHESLVIGGGSDVGLYNTPVREHLIRLMMRRAVNITSLKYSSFVGNGSQAHYHAIDWTILQLPSKSFSFCVIPYHN